MFALSLASSLVLGSALGKLFAKYLVDTAGVNFFSAQDIPSFSEELALAKTFDLLDFALTAGFVLAGFVFLYYFLKPKNKLISIAILVFNLLLFFQIHFASYNLVHTLVYLVGFYILVVVLAKTKIRFEGGGDRDKLVLFVNGLLVGFFGLVVINNITTTILPLAMLMLIPVGYLLFPVKFFRSQAHLVFALSALAPTNFVWLIFVGVAGVLAVVGINRRSDFVARFLYPTVIVALLVYNPLYYLGPFDSVEEGFWLGWISGLRMGKVLYREIAAYHPPLIVWFLSLFSNTRLGLHILQIAGMVGYYFVVRGFVKSKLGVFTIILVALGFTSIFVRNNVEIRLGLGLLSLVLFSRPVLAGAVAAAALFTSVEVGISAILAGSIVYGVFARKSLLKYFAGFGVVSVPIMMIIAVQGGVASMFSQLWFYASAFSSGYLNLPVERSVNSAFIHWHIVNQYISAYPFLWELARGGILGALVVAIYTKNKIAVGMAIFGIVLFRSALGRADIYHLLFPLLVAIPLVYFSLEKLKIKYSVALFSFLLVFVIARNAVSASYLEAKLFTLQTYGRMVGAEESIVNENERNLVRFINDTTGKDEVLFVYPWNPEIYYLANRANASSFYTPYAFFSEHYQRDMISELEDTKPSLIIYNADMKFANLTPDSLPLINNYILEQYEEAEAFGPYSVMILRQNGLH